MPITYERIQSNTISGSSTNTVNFTSIPSTYTDLRIAVVFASTTNAQGQIIVRFNGDATSSYSRNHIRGNGSAASAQSVANQTSIFMGDFAMVGSLITPPQFTTLDIFSYAGSTFKSSLMTASSDSNNDPTWGAGGALYDVSLWRNTATISSISMVNSGSNYSAGSTITLYGIKNA